MNILFLTIARLKNTSQRNIYTDLIRKFAYEGHDVYVITPLERRSHEVPIVSNDGRITIVQVKTLNFHKTNFIEKGLASFLIEYQFLIAFKKHLSKIRFDLVLYSTPPITFTRVILFLKKKCGALSYLLLKDIFPQNAIDLGIIRLDSLLHKYFRRKEKALYLISDIIGCMSPANIDFIIKNNPELDSTKVELNPNSIEIIEQNLTFEQRKKVRKKYGIPLDSVVYIYGGNLGKPQGINFLLEILDKMNGNSDVYFVIAGSGTEFLKIKQWIETNKPSNALLITQLPKWDYDQLVQSCDVGMIFLDKRFTIPNFPSRLLSYLEFRMPVIAATDVNTDIGTIIEEQNMGLWSMAGDVNKFKLNVITLSMSEELRESMGNNGFEYLVKKHDVSISYHSIVKHITLDAKRIQQDV